MHLPSNSIVAKKMESTIHQYNQLKQLCSILPEGSHLKEIECYGNENENNQYRIQLSKDMAFSDSINWFIKEYGCISTILTETLVHMSAVSEGRELIVKSVFQVTRAS